MINDLNINICKTIKELRERRGYTVVELAIKSGVDAKTIRRLESLEYEFNVSVTTLYKLATAMDRTIFEFFTLVKSYMEIERGMNV